MDRTRDTPTLRPAGEDVLDALRRPEVWPGGGPVEACETHASLVLLSGDRAWKARKAVRFPFLDYGTLESRRRVAEEEVRINRELAPDTYLGVRPIVLVDGRPVLGGVGAKPPAAVEYVVEMRRFAERDTLAARVTEGRVGEHDLVALGARLAAFHRAAPRADPPEGGAAATLARLHRNAEELAALRGPPLPADGLAAVSRTLEAAVLRRADLHDERARAGRWRDGHGDLRADHVVLDERGLRIVDRIEFDAGLRRDDVAADLGFLLMDLEARGAHWAADRVTAGYREAGGDAGDDALLALWSAYRALVSAKVALLRARQDGEAATAAAAARAALARRLAWRTRPRAAVVVCGAPATGKSTLADAVARRSGVTVVASDPLRKALHGVGPTARAPAEAYVPEASRRVYVELGRRAAAAVAADGGVVVDATMGSAALRRAFADGLAGATPCVFVECRVPAAVARDRAAARLADATRVSDAGPEVAAALAARFEPLDEVGAASHLTIRGDLPSGRALDALEAWLDLRAWPS